MPRGAALPLGAALLLVQGDGGELRSAGWAHLFKERGSGKDPRARPPGPSTAGPLAAFSQAGCGRGGWCSGAHVGRWAGRPKGTPVAGVPWRTPATAATNDHALPAPGGAAACAALAFAASGAPALSIKEGAFESLIRTNFLEKGG